MHKLLSSFVELITLAEITKSKNIIATSVLLNLYNAKVIGIEKATTIIVVTNSFTPYPLKNSNLVLIFAGIYKLLLLSSNFFPPNRNNL